MNSFKKFAPIIGVVIVGLVVGIIIISVLLAKSRQISLGKTVNVKEDNVEITVLSSEKTTIEDPTGLGIAVETGDFVKVKVRIKNNGSSDYTWNNMWSFNLGKSYVAVTEHGDDLPNTIGVGQTVEGYLYFKYTDESIMNYYTSLKADNSNSASTSKYSFKIK